MKEKEVIKVSKKVAEILDKVVEEKAVKRQDIKTSKPLDVSNLTPIG